LAEARPDVLLVAGDLFDSPHTDRAVVEEAAKTFIDPTRATQSIPVLIIPGNHDPANADRLWTVFEQTLGTGNAVRVVRMAECIALHDGQLLVECYPCPTRYSPEPPWEKRLPLPAGCDGALRIVLAHGTLQGGQVAEVARDAY